MKNFESLFEFLIYLVKSSLMDLSCISFPLKLNSSLLNSFSSFIFD